MIVDNMFNCLELSRTYHKILFSQQIKVRLHSVGFTVVSTRVVEYGGVDSLSLE